jgi:hypothetical protein
MKLTVRQAEVIESMECSGTMALEHVSSRLLCRLYSKGLFRKIGKSKDWEYYWLTSDTIKALGEYDAQF